MPYHVEKRGSKWVVVGPRGIKGTHDSKAKAERQKRALYANEPKAKKRK